MFCKKYKIRIQELESYEKTYEQRIKNQSNIIDTLNNKNLELQREADKTALERWNEEKVLASLKTECLDKSEQITRLQEIVNKRKEGSEGTDNVDELKRTIEKQAGEIGRLEAFKKRTLEKKKPATDKKSKNKK